MFQKTGGDCDTNSLGGIKMENTAFEMDESGIF